MALLSAGRRIRLQVRGTTAVVYQALVGAIAVEGVMMQELTHVRRHLIRSEIVLKIGVDFMIRKIPAVPRRSKQIENTASAGKRQVGKMPLVTHIVQGGQALFQKDFEQGIRQRQPE